MAFSPAAMAGEAREAPARASGGRKEGGGKGTEAERTWTAAIAAVKRGGACFGCFSAPVEIGTAIFRRRRDWNGGFPATTMGFAKWA